MNSQPIILSILVVSHNRKLELKRCLDSVLRQQLTFPFEVIVSDDASTDGAWELIQDYVANYPQVVFGYQVNSDDCQPTNTSERSGHNRANAYRHARGKYFVHIDGDDYLRSDTIYQRQVELLEQHPECSMCMQNVWILEENVAMEQGRVWHLEHQFETGRIISAQEFLLKDYFILNQAFVARRYLQVNPADVYGKRYVDVVITYHHLQFGSVVCLDACDYVYVKYPTAITSSLTLNDQKVLWGLAFTVYPALLIPRFAGLYYAGHIQDLLHLVNTARHSVEYSESTKKHLKQYDKAFIYRVFCQERLRLIDKVRLQLILRYLVVLMRTGFLNVFSLKLLHYLLVSTKIDKHARFNIH